MSDYFNCKLCDKSNKDKSKKKHLITKYHNSSIMSIISRYCVTNPIFFHIEDIIKNYVDDYNEKFEFYLILCKWKLHFSDTIINVKSDGLYNVRYSWNLGDFLL